MVPMVEEAKGARAYVRSSTWPFLGTLSSSESMVPWHTSSSPFGGLCVSHDRSILRVADSNRRYLGGSSSCLVTLMASDFGRVTVC